MKQSTSDRCLAVSRAACHRCATPVALPPLSSDSPVRDRVYKMFYASLFLFSQDVPEQLSIEAIQMAFSAYRYLLLDFLFQHPFSCGAYREEKQLSELLN